MQKKELKKRWTDFVLAVSQTRLLEAYQFSYIFLSSWTQAQKEKLHSTTLEDSQLSALCIKKLHLGSSTKKQLPH